LSPYCGEEDVREVEMPLFTEEMEGSEGSAISDEDKNRGMKHEGRERERALAQ